MPPVWIAPALILVVGLVAAAALLRSLLDEARGLVDEVRKARELRPALARIHHDSTRLAATARSARRRR